MSNGISDLRIIINKRVTLGISDIDSIRTSLEQITKWPWTPKQAINLCTPSDVEFVAKAPELIQKLCDHIEHLYELLGHANRIMEAEGIGEDT
jgi:hypothetical protein